MAKVIGIVPGTTFSPVQRRISMPRVTILMSLVIVLSCGYGRQNRNSVPAQTGNGGITIVEMSDFQFIPAHVTIRQGQTIRWDNTSRLVHTVTADSGLANDPANVRLPPGAESFNSGNITTGQSYERTFQVAGEYRYVCLPHEAQGMVGEITVTGE